MTVGYHTHRGCDLDTAEEIAEFVDRFYRDLAQDDRLRHYFAAVDWTAHLRTVTDYWQTVLLGAEAYDQDADRVIESHRPLHAERSFDVTLFARWLEILYRTLDGGWTGPTATLARRRGHGMAWAMAHRLTGTNLGRVGG